MELELKQLKESKESLRVAINNSLKHLPEDNPQRKKYSDFLEKVNNCKDITKLESICVNLTQNK